MEQLRAIILSKLQTNLSEVQKYQEIIKSYKINLHYAKFYKNIHKLSEEL